MPRAGRIRQRRRKAPLCEAADPALTEDLLPKAHGEKLEKTAPEQRETGKVVMQTVLESDVLRKRANIVTVAENARRDKVDLDVLGERIKLGLYEAFSVPEGKIGSKKYIFHC